MSLALVARSRGVFRYSLWDGVLVALSGVYATLLLWTPSSPLIAIGLWWTANTVAHNFIHTPFFRSRQANRAFAWYLSALMGFPQSLWRERHLRHHRGEERPTRWTREIGIESAIVLGTWLTMMVLAPGFFAGVYLPGYLVGLGLCQLQGHFEHARGTTSHYGRLYNLLFFNDGYHVEHHHRPGQHWTRLPLTVDPESQRSRWPPVLRWIDALGPLSAGALEMLERVALTSAALQRFLIASHERAFRALLTESREVHRVTIVGGGLFPRTALILRRLLPHATLTIVDAERRHLDIARRFLGSSVELRHEFFDGRAQSGTDLLIVPLSFIGDREAVYANPPARTVLVHDWIWNTRREGTRVSWLLLKRLNLVVQ
jgi:hypothetical protein